MEQSRRNARLGRGPDPHPERSEGEGEGAADNLRGLSRERQGGLRVTAGVTELYCDRKVINLHDPKNNKARAWRGRLRARED